MVDEAVTRVIRKYLRNLVEQGIPVEYGVLYGSQATGRANPWSDIDLLVVSPRFDAQHLRSDVSLLWRIAARTDSRIEPIPIGLRQYDEDDSNAVIEMARREGKIIPLAD